MIDFIQPRTTERKLRLFLASVARLGWDRLPPGELRSAVEVAEQSADGVASTEERLDVSRRMYSISTDSGAPPEVAGWFRNPSGENLSAYMAVITAVGRLEAGSITSRATWQTALVTTGVYQPALLRDIFGTPSAPSSSPPRGAPRPPLPSPTRCTIRATSR